MEADRCLTPEAGHFTAKLEHRLHVSEPGWIALRIPLANQGEREAVLRVYCDGIAALEGRIGGGR